MVNPCHHQIITASHRFKLIKSVAAAQKVLSLYVLSCPAQPQLFIMLIWQADTKCGSGHHTNNLLYSKLAGYLNVTLIYDQPQTLEQGNVTFHYH